MFFIAAYSSISFVYALMIFGPESYLTGSYMNSSNHLLYDSFYASVGFNDQFRDDIYKISQLANLNIESAETQISEQSDTVVTKATNAYLDKKAEIIQAELEYAVNNYDESYFYYEYSADLVTIPEEATVINEATITESDSIPRNIQSAQKALETASGREFLNYEALVRSEAFDCDFSYTFPIEYGFTDAYGFSSAYSEDYYFYNDNMHYSESQIKSAFYSQFNNQKLSSINNLKSSIYINKYELKELENLNYYILTSDGNIYTNTEEKPSIEAVKGYNVYAYFDGTNIYMQGIADNYTAEYIESNLRFASNVEVYLYLENELSIGAGASNDIYSDIYNAFLTYGNTSAQAYITVIVISLISAIILLIIYLCLCGHSNNYEYPVLAAIDKVPTDIHFLFSFGLITAGIVCLLITLDDFFNYSNNIYEYYSWICMAIAAFVSLFWLVLAEWLASTARIKKCEHSFFKRTLISKIINWNCRGFRKLKAKIVKEFSYKPQKMQKLTIAFIIGYILINLFFIILAAFAAFFIYEFLACLFCIALLLTFNILVIIFLMKYIRMFDTIITATCEHSDVDFGNEKVPSELKLLAENLANSNQQLNEAIAQAVKDEQMKTELITNVSHDLKTPLTSLITYSDLLSKCEITDESAIKYTSVIHQQSIKLKRLIDDLIEASKVSSGNITLNMSTLNLSELAIQAIVEYSPETEKNGNEIIFSEPEVAPKVIADSAKTYRIISNLLNNTKKYSAPDTRIYVSVFSDGINGYFEVKNISNEPLNISPDELTERFVRGDKSRSKEGNGLGLAIAKDLCNLQNGELKLIIDGDLFKAIVKLPCKTEEEKITE